MKFVLCYVCGIFMIQSAALLPGQETKATLEESWAIIDQFWETTTFAQKNSVGEIAKHREAVIKRAEQQFPDSFVIAYLRPKIHAVLMGKIELSQERKAYHIEQGIKYCLANMDARGTPTLFKTFISYYRLANKTSSKPVDYKEWLMNLQEQVRPKKTGDKEAAAIHVEAFIQLMLLTEQSFEPQVLGEMRKHYHSELKTNATEGNVAALVDALILLRDYKSADRVLEDYIEQFPGNCELMHAFHVVTGEKLKPLVKGRKWSRALDVLNDFDDTILLIRNENKDDPAVQILSVEYTKKYIWSSRSRIREAEQE